MDHFGVDEVMVRCANPEPPIPLPVGSVSVEVSKDEKTAYLGLGSNVGDRAANLRAAAAALEAGGVEVIARASIYETAPQGEVLDQPDF